MRMLHFVTFVYENFTAISGVILIAELAVLGVIERRRRKLQKEEEILERRHRRRMLQKKGIYEAEAARLYLKYGGEEARDGRAA